MILLAIGAGALAGLASIGHCALMCGPLALLAGRDLRSMLAYYGARALAYAAVGALAGASGELLVHSIPARWAGALLSWSFAAAAFFAAHRLWRAASAERTAPLVRLGRSRPRPPRWLSRLPRHPAAIGAASALLPCGALYGALALAAASGSALGGGLTMLSFALVSATGLWLLGLAAARLRAHLGSGRGRALSLSLATALVVGGALLVVRPLDSLRSPEAPPTCHTDRGSADVR